ncbi:unnamed protein product [Meloidogyne enterolobii]|uniref:Uncharacterized protein n=1 Tax=Meloidogyne enterolobii TaxID=390850 RepID=A0ACB0ZMA7_MELEN
MCDKDMCNDVMKRLNEDNNKTESQVVVAATNPPKVIVEAPPPKPPATKNFAFGKYYGDQFFIIFMLIIGRWGKYLNYFIHNIFYLSWASPSDWHW